MHNAASHWTMIIGGLSSVEMHFVCCIHFHPVNVATAASDLNIANIAGLSGACDEGREKETRVDFVSN